MEKTRKMSSAAEIKKLKADLIEYELRAAEYAQNLRKKIRELESETRDKAHKILVRKHLQKEAAKQDLIVNALRAIGRRCTAGAICKQLELAGIKVHNSEFYAKFGKTISSDARISVGEITASKFEYSLREWNKYRTQE